MSIASEHAATILVMIHGIEHTAIASPDPQKLAEWYVQHLDFTINYNSGRTVFVKARNGYMLEIITSEGTRPPQTKKDPGIRHLAIAVSDFDAVYDRLKSQGVLFEGDPIASKGTKVVFFSDPDGNYLHLLEREKPLL
jgi:glyoxylase I family protein